MKMKKYLILCLLLVAGLRVLAYEPDIDDFHNPYQYNLYRSWIKKSNFKTDTPAGFTPEKIVKLFKDNNKEIKVEYDWVKFKIINQREVIDRFGFSIPSEILLYLESLLYRINAADSSFANDFIRDSKTDLTFSNKKGQGKLDFLRAEIGNSRICSDEIINILLEESDKLIIKIIFKDAEIELRLEDRQFDLSAIRKKEVQKKLNLLPETEKPQGITVEIPKSLSLKEYIARNYHIKQTKELLHNKINNVRTFLKREFPDHDLKEIDNSYILRSTSYRDEFPDILKVKYQIQEDGIDIYSDNEHEIIDKSCIIKGGDRIDLSRLSLQEIRSLSPYLPQLLYEHRSIGSKLLNFLLIHDNVSTTLLVKTEERQKYEIESYADLLLMLNKYWLDRKIYFNVKDFRIVNGYIEFKGFLLAVKENGIEADSAEIWFHLDKEFKIDLIMMMLYPEIEL